MDATRLVKLLNLTQSTNDGEALNAIRMANALLKREGKHWLDIVKTFPPNKTSEDAVLKHSPGEWGEDEYRGFKRTALNAYNNPGVKGTVYRENYKWWVRKGSGINGIQSHRDFPNPHAAIDFFWDSGIFT
jgi:hypothetical protein